MPAAVVETHALSLCQFKTLTVEEYRLALRNLEQHYQDFLRDSQDSQAFGAEDRMQVESRYNKANQHYNTLVSTAEQGVCVCVFSFPYLGAAFLFIYFFVRKVFPTHPLLIILRP